MKKYTITLVLFLACVSGCSATLRCGWDSQRDKPQAELIGAANAKTQNVPG